MTVDVCGINRSSLYTRSWTLQHQTGACWYIRDGDVLTCSTTDSVMDHSSVAFSNCCCSTASFTASAALLTSARPTSSSSDWAEEESQLNTPAGWTFLLTNRHFSSLTYSGVEVRSPGHDRVCDHTEDRSFSRNTILSIKTVHLRNSHNSLLVEGIYEHVLKSFYYYY